jgi:hypothetical protein
MVGLGGFFGTHEDVPDSAYTPLDKKVLDFISQSTIHIVPDLDDAIGGEFQWTFWEQLRLLWVAPTPETMKEVLETLQQAALGARDVAVTGIATVCCNGYSVPINKTVVCKDYAIYIDVNVTNEGSCFGTTNVTLFAQNVSTHQIGATVQVYLVRGESKTITFFFNSTSLMKGNYTLFTNTTIVEGETYTADNACVYGWILIVNPGDVDCDGRVSLYDLTIVGTAWNSYPGDSHWCANADVDCDCHVFLYDLEIVGAHWD